MEHSTGSSPLPADYYRRHAARVRALARDATTPAVKKHLEGVALDYERLAHRVDESGSAPADGACSGQVALGETTPGKARRSAMARTHPHAEASYKVIAFEDGTFGVEVSIPDSSPTIVTPFASEEAAEAWIASHRRRVRTQAEFGVLAAGAARPLAALVLNPGRLNQPDANDFTSIVAVADPAIHTGRVFGYAARKPLAMT